MKLKLLPILAIALLTLLSGCGGAEQQPALPFGKPAVITLPQGVVDDAVLQCKDKMSWGINLAKVRTNYITGVRVEAAIVLHNGNDTERLIRLSYKQIYRPSLDAETGITYEPSPIEAHGWVTIDTNSLRMDRMETAVVPIHLLVPSDCMGLPDHWEFDIKASGTSIQQYQYTILVTTIEADETELSVHLPMPPLEGVGSILDIFSEIDEPLHVVEYNPESGILVIGGLRENSIREITIIYEYGEVVVIDYTQRWLIAMLR